MTNLWCYLIEGVIYLLLYQSSLTDHGNLVMMITQGRLSFLEGAPAEEVLCVSLYFVMARTMIVFCLYSA